MPTNTAVSFAGSLRRISILLLFLVMVGGARAATDSTVTVSLKAIPGLQFDLVRFQVKPGAAVRIRLDNTDDMAHNLVITKPGQREEVVNEALQLGEKGPAVNYIPKSTAILWTIPVVAPEETGTVSFTAPREAGVYPYVCTFPGHGFVMYGAMYVTDGALPPLKADKSIPETRRTAEPSAQAQANHAQHGPQRFHPYETEPPFLYRIFMPDAGPAAIAVSLPHGLSYCWDAGTCRLRYAWAGGFLDQATLWPGKGDTEAKLIGTVFFRNKTAYPIQMANSQPNPAVDYKGYQLLNRYPEFHYTVDGVDVYEQIQAKEDGSGLIRTFKMPKAEKPIWFVTEPNDGVTYQSSGGQWEGGRLKLSPAEARQFTITMTKKAD
ncbi:plastocyanin/azurin family copper-binding protein [Larkinella insperata]|uniref:Plastocyanin/azurin family copper-binding protein n=1 Tax=Larkinella insperata TaxID=332158 RepID=A0ABW3PY04_9BACT|nr:plastocyanin/azurin family copper-binding protein [Larkinella insperata]